MFSSLIRVHTCRLMGRKGMDWNCLENLWNGTQQVWAGFWWKQSTWPGNKYNTGGSTHTVQQNGPRHGYLPRYWQDPHYCKGSPTIQICSEYWVLSVEPAWTPVSSSVQRWTSSSSFPVEVSSISLYFRRKAKEESLIQPQLNYFGCTFICMSYSSSDHIIWCLVHHIWYTFIAIWDIP